MPSRSLSVKRFRRPRRSVAPQTAAQLIPDKVDNPARIDTDPEGDWGEHWKRQRLAFLNLPGTNRLGLAIEALEAYAKTRRADVRRRHDLCLVGNHRKGRDSGTARYWRAPRPHGRRQKSGLRRISVED